MRNRSGFGWLEFTEGILLIMLGIFTFIRPNGMLTGIVVIYGIIAIIMGVVDIIFYIRVEQHIGVGPVVSLISGILSVMSGVMLLIFPRAGKMALSLLFPIWFCAHCISRLSHLHIIRRIAGNFYYYFTLIIYVIGLVMGLIMAFFPMISLLFNGYVIGIYLIIFGVDCLMMALGKPGLRL